MIQAFFVTWLLTHPVAPEDIYYKPSYLPSRPTGRPAIGGFQIGTYTYLGKRYNFGFKMA